jgi:acyl-CoA thioesterase-1
MATKLRPEPDSSPPYYLGWLQGKSLAFIGDSITADLRWNYVTLCVDKLADHVDVTSMTFVNSGVDSSSILDAMDRLPDILIEHDPDVLVVFIGVNDSKIFHSSGKPLMSAEVFEQSYATFLQCADAKRCRQKVLVTIPPLLFGRIRSGELLKTYWYWTPEHYAEYVHAIRRVASHPVCVVADVHDLFLREGDGLARLFDTDGVHPNIYGHRLIARVILEALGELGELRTSRS